MIVKNDLILEIRRILIYFRRIHPLRLVSPYIITKKGSRIQDVPYTFKKDPRFNIHFWGHFILLFGATLSVGLTLALSQDSQTVFGASIRKMLIFLFLNVLITTLVQYNRAGDVDALVNQLLRLETRHGNDDCPIDPECKQIADSSRLICILLVLEGLLFPIAAMFGVGVPWNIAPPSIHQPFPRLESDFLHILWWIVIFLWNIGCWVTTTQIAAVNQTLNVVILSYSLKSALMIFERRFKEAKTQQEAVKVIAMYKEIQLLASLNNEIHQRVFHPTYVTGWMCFFIFCCYSAISQFSSLELAAWSAFAFGTIISGVTIIMNFGFPGAVYTKSSCILDRERHKVYGTFCSTKLNRRVMTNVVKKYWRSLEPISVGMGSNNFFDNMTPLNSFRFCVDQVVNLVLL